MAVMRSEGWRWTSGVRCDQKICDGGGAVTTDPLPARKAVVSGSGRREAPLAGTRPEVPGCHQHRSAAVPPRPETVAPEGTQVKKRRRTTTGPASGERPTGSTVDALTRRRPVARPRRQAMPTPSPNGTQNHAPGSTTHRHGELGLQYPPAEFDALAEPEYQPILAAWRCELEGQAATEGGVSDKQAEAMLAGGAVAAHRPADGVQPAGPSGRVPSSIVSSRPPMRVGVLTVKLCPGRRRGATLGVRAPGGDVCSGPTVRRPEPQQAIDPGSQRDRCVEGGPGWSPS